MQFIGQIPEVVQKSFIDGFLKEPRAEEMTLLGIVAIGGSVVFPGSEILVYGAGIALGRIIHIAAEFFSNLNNQSTKLEQETKILTDKFKAIQALEERDEEALWGLKQALDKSYAIADVATRTLLEGAEKLDKKVNEVIPIVHENQLLADMIKKKIEEERALRASIHAACDEILSIPLELSVRVLEQGVDRYVAFYQTKTHLSPICPQVV